MKTERLVLGMLHTNCYIVYDEHSKEAIVVDPADSYPEIKDKILESDLQVKYIILTHAHCDHIGALDQLVDDTGALVCIGADDAIALNDGELNLCNYLGNSSPTSKADIIINDGDIMKLSDNTIKFITTPGHTKGSISIVVDDAVFSGDTLFYESIGRTDFATSDTLAIFDSIKNKLYALGREMTVYPGHGESTSIGHEIDNNPFVW